MKAKELFRTPRTSYRLALAIALVTSLLLVWLSLGVGIIGRDGDPANRMYFVVMVPGILGALLARFRPQGMARAMIVMALGQALVALIALAMGLGQPWSGPLELLGLNAGFIALFAASAFFFQRAHALLVRTGTVQP